MGLRGCWATDGMHACYPRSVPVPLTARLWCCSTRCCALVNIHSGAGNTTLTGLLPNLQGVSLCEVPATAARPGDKEDGGIYTESNASPHVGMNPFRRPAPVQQLTQYLVQISIGGAAAKPGHMQGQQTVNNSRGYMDRPILALQSVGGCAGPHRPKVA